METSNPYRTKSQHRRQTGAGVEVDLTRTMEYIRNAMVIIQWQARMRHLEPQESDSISRHNFQQ
jgi:hypothetical protein